MVQDREGRVVTRREVGCQSNSAERRDAAVQVDLLSWRRCAGVCGVPRHCVSVRADEPGGGALLQHCTTHSLDSGEHSPPLSLLCSPLRHSQLPTMPLFGPSALPAPQPPELQQTTSLPSMPLCEKLPLLLPPADISAPPPGLIAPLSPRLAEEEGEEEGGAKPVKTEETEQVWRPRRKTVGPPIRYLLESEERSHDPSAASLGKVGGGKVKRKLERLRREHEEEQQLQEEEEGLIKHENNESFTITAEKKRRKAQWSEGSTHSSTKWGEKSLPIKLTNHIAGRRTGTRRRGSTVHRKRKMDDDERSQPACHQAVSQSEERRSIQKVRSETLRGEMQQHCRERGIKTRRPAARIQRTRAEGENKTTVRKKEEEEKEKQLPEEEGGHTRRYTEEQRKEEFRVREEDEDGVKSVKMEEMERAGRPRRKTVGPPIRYLLESEQRSHGPSVANHSKAWRPKLKRKLGIQSGEEQEEEEEEQQHQEEEEDRRGGVETDSSRVEASEDGGVEGRWQLCQVCGLTFTCQSSLQFHLSIHRTVRRLSCHLCYKNFSHTKTLRLHHLRHHHGNPVSRYSNRAMPEVSRTTDDKQDEEDSSNSNGKRKKREERSKLEEQKALLPASTKAPDWSRRTKRVCRNPWWWIDYRTTMKRRQDAKRWRWKRQQEKDGERGRNKEKVREEEEEEEEEEEVKQVCLREEGGGERRQQEGEEREQEGESRRDREEEEEKEEEKERWTEVKKERMEQPQRPRRKMVGPPIRYLLESEEPSHCPVTANEDRGNRGNRPKGGGGRPNKVELYSVAGGGASEMIDRSDTAESRVGQTVTERQTGHMIAKRQKTVFPASTKTPDWLRIRKCVRRNPCWWVDYRITMRRRREKDKEMWGREKRCREEGDGEADVQQVSLKKKGGGEEIQQGGEEGQKEGEKRRRVGGGEKKEEKDRQTEEKKEVVEEPQRLRRKMVGPPIKYLLESEEPSHCPVTANEDRAFKQNAKPQRKSQAMGGASEDTAMSDRPDDTEQTDRLAGQTVTERQTDRTNQDGGNRPKGRGERPNKDMLDSEAGGGASEMIDTAEKQTRQTITETQTGHISKERQTGQTDTERQTGQTDTERQTGQTDTERHTGRKDTEGQTGRQDTEGQTGQMDTERQIGQTDTERQIGQTDTERQTCHTIKERQTEHIITERQAGRQDTERQTGQMDTERHTGRKDTERQTGSYRKIHLVYMDLQSRQVTIISPCCVRLQRLPLIG